MNVLQLVTTRRPFFEQQLDVLEQNGISCDVLTVPGGGPGTRSLVDYLRFYGATLDVVSKKYDLVHANYGLTAPMALAQPVRPVVLSLWGSDLFGRYGTVSKVCAQFADEVVVMSPEMAEELDDACHVIPHGIDFTRFEPSSTDAAKRSVGWDPSVSHVLFPYDPDRTEKNYPRAERVVDAVDERLDSPVTLEVVYGVPHERIPTYMNAADALLLTSTHEGSPNSVKEALACNTPVVSVDVGDVETVVSGASHSVVCDGDDELVAALCHVLSAAEAPDGRTAIEPLSLSRMGERLTNVYRGAVEHRQRC